MRSAKLLLLVTSLLIPCLIAGCDGRKREAEQLITDGKPADALKLADEILKAKPTDQDARVLRLRALIRLGGKDEGGGRHALLREVVARGWDPNADPDLARLSLQDKSVAFDDAGAGEPVVNLGTAPCADGSILAWTKSKTLLRLDPSGKKEVLFRLADHPDIRPYNDAVVRVLPFGSAGLLVLTWVERRGGRWQTATFRVGGGQASQLGRFEQERDTVDPICTDDGQRILGFRGSSTRDTSPDQLFAIDPSTGARTLVAETPAGVVGQALCVPESRQVIFGFTIPPASEDSRQARGRFLRSADVTTGVMTDLLDLATVPPDRGDPTSDEYWHGLYVDIGLGADTKSLFVGLGGRMSRFDLTTHVLDGPIWSGFARSGGGGWIATVEDDVAWRTTWERWQAWQNALENQNAPLPQWRIMLGVN